jgi:methionyl-tRNA formyltransferase
MKQPRIIFAGTPEFAVASLAALVESGTAPVAVMTQPDRPAGRGKRLSESAVKQYALGHGIAVMQPRTLREDSASAAIRALEPELIVVAAYGLLLPQAVLDIPSGGCLNVHASLLPRWRGAAPIQAAILAGDEQTGVSLMSMTAGLDSGPVYASEAVTIGPSETAGALHDRLARLGAELLLRHLGDILAGELRAVAQDDALASYAPKIDKQDARIDWQLPAEVLLRRVRAYNPVPGAWFMLDDERIKCWSATAAAAPGAPAGTILAAGAGGIIVACGDGALRLESLQRPGRRPVTAAEFAARTGLSGRRL